MGFQWAEQNLIPKELEMKAAILSAVMILTTSTLAVAANPTELRVTRVLNRSVVLKHTVEGVKKAYGMQTCNPFAVTSYAREEGAVTAEALCVYKDSFGDESGVIIKTEGSFYDNDTYMVSKIEFTFAG